MSKMVVVYFKDFGKQPLSDLTTISSQIAQENTQNSKLSLIPFKEALIKNLLKRGKPEFIATKEVDMIISAFVNAELNRDNLRKIYQKSRQKEKFIFTSEVAAQLESYWKVYAPLGYDMMSCINTLTTLTDFLDPQNTLQPESIPLVIQPKPFRRENSNLLEIPQNAAPPPDDRTLSSILTSLMEESNPDKEEEVITLDDSGGHDDLPALTSGVISKKVEDLKRALDFLKEDRYLYQEFRSNHFSLALVAQYARENLPKYCNTFYRDGLCQWSESEVWDFGEYVINVIAYAGKSHYGLKTMYENGTIRSLEEVINNSHAFQYLTPAFDVQQITNLCSLYFSCGYYKCKASRNKK